VRLVYVVIRILYTKSTSKVAEGSGRGLTVDENVSLIHVISRGGPLNTDLVYTLLGVP